MRGTRAGLAVILLATLAAFVPPAEAVTSLRAYATTGAASADPGDIVAFTIILDNQGPTFAASVWANVTLPVASTFVDDTAITIPPYMGTWVAGGVRHYNFTSLGVANHSFDIRARIGVGPPDGATLTLSMRVNYTDDAGVLQPESAAAASVTMAIPTLSLTKAPSANPVDPGAALTYTLSVRNTGSRAADTVWLNDTLPPEVAFVRVRGIPPARCTNEDCEIRNLGSLEVLTFSIDVTVSPSAVRGTAFVNRLSVNFTDDDGSHVLAPVWVEAWCEVRVIRDLMVDKVANAPLAYPGASVTFTIWYNNSASSDLGATWLNDTLPSGLVYNASAPPAAVSGSTVRWQFPNVATGANSVQIVATVSPTVANGTILVNNATAEYVDGAGLPGLPVLASSSIAISTSLPRFDEFTKGAAAAEAPRGATVRFTVWYNNTGTDAAGVVVIEDTIPPGTTLTNPSAAPIGVNGRRHTWRFADVPAGAHVLTYDLILGDVAAGDTIFNVAYLNYTDPNGAPLPPAPPRSASVRVSAAPVDGGGSWLAAILGVAVLAGVGGFAAYRLRSRGETVIDEVFLLHKDGLLIKHYTRRIRPDVDSDILSGMLIAVQNFVNESFIGAEGLQKEGQLDELRFGEFKMVIERGQWVIVAAVLSGDPTNRVKEEVKAAIADLEAALGPKLEGWTGDMRSVEGADAYVQNLIAGAYRGRARGKG